MIKHLHSKNASSKQNQGKRPGVPENTTQMLRELSEDLLQPREQAIANILVRAAATNLPKR